MPNLPRSIQQVRHELDDYLADPASRFATVAMADTNGLLRGQMVSVGSLKGIAKNGMGMAPAQLALDPTDVMLTMPGVNDDSGDFHDDPLRAGPDQRAAAAVVQAGA